MPKSIIIVGGGFTGAECAKILDENLPSNYDIHLFDVKDYFQFTPSIHKILTNLKYEKKIKVPYSRFLKKTKIHLEEVNKVTKKYVKTSNKTYPYDYLVVCSGAKVKTPPIKAPNIYLLKTIEDAKLIHEALKTAGNVTIVGGGYTGTEVAGELINKTDKNINLIQRSPVLLERQYLDASNIAHTYLTKKGVNLHFEQEIYKHQLGFVLTTKREKIPCEVLIWCTGIKPNTSFLDKSFKRNEQGYLLTTSTLNLKGSRNIFVGGDVTDLQEEKSAQNAEHHGLIIANNIINSINHKKLQEYTPQKRSMVISLGDYYSIFSSDNLAWGGWIPALMKKLIEKIVVWKYKYPGSKMLIIQEWLEDLFTKTKEKTKISYSKVSKIGKVYKAKYFAKRYDYLKSLLNYTHKLKLGRIINTKRKRLRSKTKRTSKRRRN